MVGRRAYRGSACVLRDSPGTSDVVTPGRHTPHQAESERWATPRDASAWPVTDLVEMTMTETFTIDCATCVMQHTDACDDCIVTFICSREPDEAVVVDVGEVRALRLLSDSGLLPGLRHERRTG